MQRLSGIFAMLLLAGCATKPNVAYDPYEPYNRSVYSFNTAVDRNVIKPLAQGYKAVTPSPVRTGVDNFFNNIKDVFSAGFNLLRWEPGKAANDTMRVLMNSSFGLFGLIDVASQAGLQNNKTSLGDTFATWGWQNSNYFVLPLFGPSTVRDGSGQVIALVMPGPEKNMYDGTGEAIAFYGLYGVNTRAKFLGLESALEEAAVDPYAYTRDTYMQLRAKQLGLANPVHATIEDINLDDLMESPTLQQDLHENQPTDQKEQSQ